MPERQRLDRVKDSARVAEDGIPVAEDGIPEIETPLIDMQDLEHKPGPHTRVNTKGIKVKPEPEGPTR